MEWGKFQVVVPIDNVEQAHVSWQMGFLKATFVLSTSLQLEDEEVSTVQGAGGVLRRLQGCDHLAADAWRQVEGGGAKGERLSISSSEGGRCGRSKYQQSSAGLKEENFYIWRCDVSKAVLGGVLCCCRGGRDAKGEVSTDNLQNIKNNPR